MRKIYNLWEKNTEEIPAEVRQLQAIFEKLEPNGILIKFMVYIIINNPNYWEIILETYYFILILSYVQNS